MITFFNNVWDDKTFILSSGGFMIFHDLCVSLTFLWFNKQISFKIVQCLMLSSRKTTYYLVCIGGGSSISTLTSVFFIKVRMGWEFQQLPSVHTVGLPLSMMFFDIGSVLRNFLFSSFVASRRSRSSWRILGCFNRTGWVPFSCKSSDNRGPKLRHFFSYVSELCSLLDWIWM